MTWRSKEKSVREDQISLLSQFEDLVLQALYACIVRDVVKEYRHRRAETFHKYNTVATFSHVALENYSLLQLWKLFDQKNSTMHAWYVVEHMPHSELKAWFDSRIKELEPDIEYISVWRHNAVGHRSAIGHFAPRVLEASLKNERGNEDRIKQFLLDLLCEIKFSMFRTPREEHARVFQEILASYRGLVENDRDDILRAYDS